MIDKETIAQCKQKLIRAKEELLNRFSNYVADFRERDHRGDEVDQTVSILTENQLFAAQQRLRKQIFEIEAALSRIERGTYGICEETGEPISLERLLAIPWTRLSIEGAEIRESGGSKRA